MSGEQELLWRRTAEVFSVEVRVGAVWVLYREHVATFDAALEVAHEATLDRAVRAARVCSLATTQVQHVARTVERPVVARAVAKLASTGGTVACRRCQAQAAVHRGTGARDSWAVCSACTSVYPV